MVIKVKFSKSQDIFLVAQLNGRVSIYSYDDDSVKLIGRLNSDVWPTTREQRALAEKEEKQKLMIRRRISKAFSTPTNKKQT